MNKTSDKDTPRFDIQLLFDEIGVLLDDNQYRDAISLVDMYHFYIRQHQVSSFTDLSAANANSLSDSIKDIDHPRLT